jgi:hypothetical protein
MRRLWAGQVRSLLPIIEEWRVLLIEQAKIEGFVASGVEVHELEVGSLHDHLRSSQGPSRRRTLTSFAAWLRGTRNKIAHLSVIDPAREREGEELALAALRDV